MNNSQIVRKQPDASKKFLWDEEEFIYEENLSVTYLIGCDDNTRFDRQKQVKVQIKILFRTIRQPNGKIVSKRNGKQRLLKFLRKFHQNPDQSIAFPGLFSHSENVFIYYYSNARWMTDSAT